MKQKELSNFLEKGLHYMLDAEHQILEGLRWMEERVSLSSLKKAFQRHEKETRNQISRLKKVCDILAIGYKEPEESTAQKALGKGKEILKDIIHLGANTNKTGVVRSLIEEGKEMADRFKEAEPHILDIALSGGAQQLELAEISAYSLLCHFAQQLGEEEALHLLQQNLDEEKKMFAALDQITQEELLYDLKSATEHKKQNAVANH